MNPNVHLRFVFDKYGFAILCNESVEELSALAKSGKLPTIISRKRLNGDWVFGVAPSTHALIKTLKKKGVTKIFQLLSDTQRNGFIWDLKRDVNILDLTSYY